MLQICPRCRKRYQTPKPGRYSCRACGPTVILMPVPDLSTAAPPPPRVQAPPPPRIPGATATERKQTAPPGAAEAPLPSTPQKPADKPRPESTAGPGQAAGPTPDPRPEAKSPPAVTTQPEPPTAGVEEAAAVSVPPLSPEVEAKVAAFEDKLRAQPTARPLYLQLSQLYSDIGRRDLAIQTLERYLAVDPTNRFILDRVEQMRRTAPRTGRPVRIKLSSPHAGKGQRANERQAKEARYLFLGVGVIALVLVGLAVRPLFIPSARPLVVEPWSAALPLWSPTGERIAFVAQREGTRLTVQDMASGSRQSLAEVSGDFVWSPDGRKLAFESHGRRDVDDDSADLWGGWPAVYSVLAAGGKPQFIGYGSQPSWAPDSDHLVFRCRTSDPEDYEAFAQEREDICIADPVAGEVDKLFDGGGSRPRYSPSGDAIVFEVVTDPDWEAYAAAAGEAGPGGRSGRDMDEILEDALSGGATNDLDARQGLQREMETEQHDAGDDGGGPPLPRGKSDLYLIQTDGTGIEQLTHDGASSAPRWSADGRYIVFVFESGARPELWRMRPDGSDREPILTGLAFDPEETVLTPDGERVVYRTMIEGANVGIAMTMARAVPADLFVARIGGEKPKRLENRHAFKQRFTLSADGEQIAYEYTNPETGATELWRMDL